MTKKSPELNSLKKQSKPSAEFKKVLWAELSNEFDHRYPSMIHRIRHRFALPTAVLCLFLLTGVGSYAYGSPAGAEDHILFPIKDGMETVEGWTHRSAHGRAEFHERMTERRIEEGEFKIEHDKVSLPHIERINQSFQRTLSTLDESGDDYELRDEMLLRMRTHHARYEFILTESIENETEASVPDELRNVLLDLRVHIDESDLTEEEKSSLLRHQRRR